MRRSDMAAAGGVTRFQRQSFAREAELHVRRAERHARLLLLLMVVEQRHDHCLPLNTDWPGCTEATEPRPGGGTAYVAE
jgi:hypothetical protein